MQLKISNVNQITNIKTSLSQIQEVKKRCNILMDRRSYRYTCHVLAPCTQYAVYILNHLSSPTLQQKTPLEVVTGQQPDISAILAFHSYQPVYFGSTKPTYSSQNVPDALLESLNIKVMHSNSSSWMMLPTELYLDPNYEL
jgi:hypothetical protein